MRSDATAPQEKKMKMSARNCIEGKIIDLKEGHVACEVTIASPAGEKVIFSIMTTSTKSLDLSAGAKAYVVNKDQPTSAAGALRPNARP